MGVFLADPDACLAIFPAVRCIYSMRAGLVFISTSGVVPFPWVGTRNGDAVLEYDISETVVFQLRTADADETAACG